MVFKVNGGIINDQTLTGGMRFFRLLAPLLGPFLMAQLICRYLFRVVQLLPQHISR